MLPEMLICDQAELNHVYLQLTDDMPISRQRRRKDVSLDEVIRLYRKEEQTAQEIADKFGVHRETIYRWLKKEGIQRRPAYPRTTKTSPEELRDLYERKQMTMRDIARELDVMELTIRRWFKKFNIPTRPRWHGSQREQIQ